MPCHSWRGGIARWPQPTLVLASPSLIAIYSKWISVAIATLNECTVSVANALNETRCGLNIKTTRGSNRNVPHIRSHLFAFRNNRFYHIPRLNSVYSFSSNTKTAMRFSPKQCPYGSCNAGLSPCLSSGKLTTGSCVSSRQNLRRFTLRLHNPVFPEPRAKEAP